MGDNDLADRTLERDSTVERLDEDSQTSLTDTQRTKDVGRLRKTTRKQDGNVNEETENLKRNQKNSGAKKCTIIAIKILLQGFKALLDRQKKVGKPEGSTMENIKDT